ncbi:MAG: hypothetical protein P8X96_03910 [Desulfobacteraceae bacterium]
MAYAILASVDLVSELFAGLIFSLGAVFVWLGIILQHHMIALIQSRYKQASEAKYDLEIERERLETANHQLISEIGERRRAETALRESEQRLKFILDQIPSGILIVDESSMIIKSGFLNLFSQRKSWGAAEQGWACRSYGERSKITTVMSTLKANRNAVHPSLYIFL